MSERLEKCLNCGALIDEEDLFCGNCGTEAPHREGREADQATMSTLSFDCESCGASMSYSAKEGTLRCPFCGSEKLKQKKDHKTIAPEAAIPFSIDRSQAERLLRDALKKGYWRPSDLSDAAIIEKITPVYVPFWVFQAKVFSNWTADTSDLPYGARGDWRPVSGQHNAEYRGLLVGASGALTPQETDAIGPFHLNAAVQPSSIDFDSYTVEDFKVSRKYARPYARNGLEELERQACDAEYVPPRSRNVKVNLRIQDMSSEPMLLPIWIMAYRYKDQVFRFLINGQTGKNYGQAPVSYAKIGVAIAVTVGVALVFLAAMAVCAGIAGR
ncbi:zinc ribbon domain-containing protein [Blastopirellula sp. JC732]|uniref:Zinc ribbon domain-containing protein n=1 Tax=Blastopirellula sediminis TaxID=2894196 RepID=A0A9X1MSI3_9BACT|nr:zinc ribbon domain-containing protein [Blastopirellula sediminis]MCC9605418.1 zinc ribbon domain-containing protein [Blastopirellula sediminis]MCC9631282.1 zinc ribbon domain-containing protein [Blastopirellula sediminis]